MRWLTKLRPKPDILRAGNPLLRQKSLPVQPDLIGSGDTRRLVTRMISVMRKDRGQGLSAIQLGEPKRISVFEITDAMVAELDPEFMRALKMEVLPLMTLVNYTVTPRGNHTSVNREGCLSVPGLSAFVERPLNVHVSGFDEFGSPLDFDAYGWTARLLQHEWDHLEGVLYTDRMIQSTLAFGDELNSRQDFLDPPIVHS
eukprot:m.57652 g.57652  ORF g.57652 m.57652 type:complete len:200 (+) comp9366_c0_seq1:330-929(+)